MSNDNKEVKKEELLEKQKAQKLTEEELEQVTGGIITVTGGPNLKVPKTVNVS